MFIDINEQDYLNRCRNGKIVVCRMCKDTKGRIRMIDYFPGDKGVVLSFCEECNRVAQACGACQKN